MDSYEIGHAIPHCELTAEWTKQDKQLSCLKQKVILKGAKTPYNYFLIVIDTAPPQTSDTSLGKYLAYCDSCAISKKEHYFVYPSLRPSGSMQTETSFTL